MGAVFEAEDPQLGRTVALKVMIPKLSRNPEAKARFLREARAQAAIEHDHVVAIHQVGESNGTPFIAMPLLRGETLAAAMRRGRLPTADVLRIGREIAEGLAAAHEKKLIHRDIKPANIWLEGPRRRVEILDFGLAWIPPQRADGQDALTALGLTLDTPEYMSPEQARGQFLDPRSDLFSLGVVLYEMAAGVPPFGEPNTRAVLTSLAVDTPPPVSLVNPNIPASLADAIARLLSKRPSDRPPSAAAVAETLRRMGESLTLLYAEIPVVAAPTANP